MNENKPNPNGFFSLRIIKHGYTKDGQSVSLYKMTPPDGICPTAGFFAINLNGATVHTTKSKQMACVLYESAKENNL